MLLSLDPTGVGLLPTPAEAVADGLAHGLGVEVVVAEASGFGDVSLVSCKSSKAFFCWF
jgi:hypothetical protein